MTIPLPRMEPAATTPTVSTHRPKADRHTGLPLRSTFLLPNAYFAFLSLPGLTWVLWLWKGSSERHDEGLPGVLTPAWN
ncbi:hypothetical protein CPLU01_09323 [Colletotrichum plurivorum]|uniref:Uncharacterized protein n=1 Tax=Colletotrichum plurivorum TaxID=2175906 RepID=A0A8H6NBA5_9PEZI|nr:hypothetical protein CPLU01_09323 [Colletotrichum plurivorum]